MLNFLECIKKTVFSVLLALAAGLLFFSCTSPLNGTVQAKSGVSIIVTNYNQNPDSSRTIAPNTFNFSNIAKFKIEGEDLDGEKIPLQLIDIDENGNGEIGELKNSVWSFILHAYSDSSAANEVLCGYASVDTKHTSTVSFVLSSEGVVADGTYSFNLKYVASANDTVSFASAVSQISVSLCNPQTYEPIAGYPKTISDSENIAKWTSSSGYPVSGTVSAGYYYLLVKFFARNTSNTLTQIGIYSDFVDVQPGRATTVTDPIEISGILYQKPAAPANLKVYRIDNSLNAEYYTAALTWEDNSVNEESFVINCYQYDSAETSSANALPLQIDTSSYTSISLARDGLGYVDGSVLAGSEFYVVKLKTGYLYDFEIYAENSMGASAVCSRVATSDYTPDDVNDPLYSYGALSGFGVSSTNPYLRVNTFNISYNLKGGTYRDPLGNAMHNYTRMDYYIYTGSVITLFEPEDINATAKASGDVNDLTVSDSFPIIYFGAPNRYWTNWIDTYGTTVTETPSAATAAFKNYTVYAVYSSTQIDSVSSLDSSGLKLSFDSSDYPSPGEGNNITDGSILAVSSVKYVTFALDITDTPNSSFTQFDFYVNGIVQSDDVLPSSAITVSGKKYIVFQFQPTLKGSYILQVAGLYGTATYFSQELSFTLR